MEISGFEVFKEKIEKGIGRSISISELMVTINDPGIIDSVVRRIVSISRKIDKHSYLILYNQLNRMEAGWPPSITNFN